MSEYIYEHVQSGTDHMGRPVEQPMLVQREEIVRCRDCVFSRIHDGNRYPGKKAKGMTYCISWGDGMQADWTKPDGYCHKAKPRGDV